MKRDRTDVGAGIIVFVALWSAGCATSPKQATQAPPPQPGLKLGVVRNDFASPHLPDVLEFELHGHAVADCRVRLLLIEDGSVDKRGVLDDVRPQTANLAGRICLIRTARPDPEGNPRALWPRQIHGFRLACRIDPLPPQSFGGSFEVRPRSHAGNSWSRPAGTLRPGQPQVLFVQWFGPLFDRDPDAERFDTTPPTIEHLKQITSEQPKTSAVALALTWHEE